MDSYDERPNLQSRYANLVSVEKKNEYFPTCVHPGGLRSLKNMKNNAVQTTFFSFFFLIFLFFHYLLIN